jgi:hypothetical protein
LILGVIFPTFLASWLWSIHKARKRAPLPPGPKGLPLIGNLFQIPLEQPWEVYRDWKEQYGEHDLIDILCSHLLTFATGDIIYLDALGQRLLVLNSLESVKDLLVSRASNYSDRADGPLLDL